MHFKLIIALVDCSYAEACLKAARKAGATGSTLISQARGEGLSVSKSFFGLNLQSQRDVLLFLVEEHLSRHILETLSEVGQFDESGGGIAFQIDVEDAVGVKHQIAKLAPLVEEEI